MGLPPASVHAASRPVTDLLHAWGEGDESALAQLMPLVRHELHRLARRHMRGEHGGHTLQTTALVNEAYLRLVDLGRMGWQDRRHFFAMAARLMRRILVDHARSRQFVKRGGGARKIAFDESTMLVERNVDLIKLDDALRSLSNIDPRKGQVVEMRFFAGFSVEEIAAALGVSPITVMRDWRVAKAWLFKELRGRG